MTDQNLHDDSFWAAVEEEASAAESFGQKAQFGKFSISATRYVHWADQGGTRVPIDVSAEVFNTLPPNDRMLELIFKVDIQEFKPSLDWTYERKIAIQGGDSDWAKVFLPSLAKAIGKKVDKGNYAQVLQNLRGRYVEAHDVPQAKNKEYNTIHIERVFDSRDECFAEWQARFGGQSNSSTPAATPAPVASGDVPAGWSREAWLDTVRSELTAGKIPSDIATSYGVTVAQVAAAKKELGLM